MIWFKTQFVFKIRSKIHDNTNLDDCSLIIYEGIVLWPQYTLYIHSARPLDHMNGPRTTSSYPEFEVNHDVEWVNLNHASRYDVILVLFCCRRSLWQNRPQRARNRDLRIWTVCQSKCILLQSKYYDQCMRYVVFHKYDTFWHIDIPHASWIV